MPVIEYLHSPTGEKIERMYYPTEEVPELICDGDKVFRKCPSMPTIRFVGAFSGATSSKYIVKPDDGRIKESGTDRDTYRRQQEIAAKNEKEMDEIIGDTIREFN